MEQTAAAASFFEKNRRKALRSKDWKSYEHLTAFGWLSVRGIGHPYRPQGMLHSSACP